MGASSPEDAVIDNGLVEMLLNTNKTLTDSVEGLQARVNELEDLLDRAEDALEGEAALRKQYEMEANIARELAKAVRDLLSWRESPPRRMDPSVYSGVDASFRRALEEVLRKIEG